MGVQGGGIDVCAELMQVNPLKKWRWECDDGLMGVFFVKYILQTKQSECRMKDRLEYSPKRKIRVGKESVQRTLNTPRIESLLS